MDLPLFLVLTLLAHGCFAAAIALHARATDRDAGNLPYLTLAIGVVGVAAYVYGDR